MKRMDNRQNKLPQIKPQIGRLAMNRPVHFDQPLNEDDLAPSNASFVFGLVKDLLLATKIAQSAKNYGMNIHNFDKSEAFMESAQKKTVALMILDWDGCEAEAFKVLNRKRQCADLKGVPVIGYLSQNKQSLRDEAQRAGCDRVYTKTEFTRTLDDLMMRYAR